MVRDCTPERVAQICGVSPQDLHEAARLFATSPATLSLYCQGLNQSSSGTAKNAALINLHLATGQGVTTSVALVLADHAAMAMLAADAAA